MKKERKVLLFATIIILIGISISLILEKNMVVKSNKQTIKEMSESTQVEELNNQINSLNAEHTAYMNYIQTCKNKIATALTNEGIETSSEETLETMAENISKIYQKATSNMCRVIYLGSGTSFDLKNIEGVSYADLTVSNFIVQSTASGSARGGSTHVDNYNCGPMAKCSLTKTYNASTGTLTAYQYFDGGYYCNNSGSYSGSASGKLNVDAYLIIGTIENV